MLFFDEVLRESDGNGKLLKHLADNSITEDFKFLIIGRILNFFITDDNTKQ